MDSDKIDELAAIAYQAYEGSIGSRVSWSNLDSIKKNAWRQSVSELINRISLDSMDSTWCYWVIEAGETDDKGVASYSTTVTLTERDRRHEEAEKLFTIKMVSATECINRLIRSGARWATLTWKLGSK